MLLDFSPEHHLRLTTSVSPEHQSDVALRPLDAIEQRTCLRNNYSSWGMGGGPHRVTWTISILSPHDCHPWLKLVLKVASESYLLNEYIGTLSVLTIWAQKYLVILSLFKYLFSEGSVYWPG